MKIIMTHDLIHVHHTGSVNELYSFSWDCTNPQQIFREAHESKHGGVIMRKNDIGARRKRLIHENERITVYEYSDFYAPVPFPHRYRSVPIIF